MSHIIYIHTLRLSRWNSRYENIYAWRFIFVRLFYFFGGPPASTPDRKTAVPRSRAFRRSTRVAPNATSQNRLAPGFFLKRHFEEA